MNGHRKLGVTGSVTGVIRHESARSDLGPWPGCRGPCTAANRILPRLYGHLCCEFRLYGTAIGALQNWGRTFRLRLLLQHQDSMSDSRVQ